jgi:4-coumarate--CoA ligase
MWFKLVGISRTSAEFIFSRQLKRRAKTVERSPWPPNHLTRTLRYLTSTSGDFYSNGKDLLQTRKVSIIILICASTTHEALEVIYLDPVSGRQYTFEQVRRTAAAFGSALRMQWNWQKGDVISFFSTNCVDYPASIFGALWAGGVISPSNPAYSASDLAFQLKDCGVKAIVTQVSSLESVLEAAKIVGIPQSRILLIGDEKHPEVQHFSDFITPGPVKVRMDRVLQMPSDLACLAYSSGTTGLPKGVMLTHGNIVSDILMMDVGQAELSHGGGPGETGDTIIAVLPFYHIYGMLFIMFSGISYLHANSVLQGLQLLITHPIFAGLKTIILPRFELNMFCKAIQDHKVTFAYLVPPLLLLLSQSPEVEKYELSSIKMSMCAAATLPLPLVEAVWRRLKIPVKQAYGMSEASAGTHFQVSSTPLMGLLGVAHNLAEI